MNTRIARDMKSGLFRHCFQHGHYSWSDWNIHRLPFAPNTTREALYLRGAQSDDTDAPVTIESLIASGNALKGRVRR